MDNLEIRMRVVEAVMAQALGIQGNLFMDVHCSKKVIDLCTSLEGYIINGQASAPVNEKKSVNLPSKKQTS